MTERRRPAEAEPTVPPVVYAEASVRSVGGTSLFSDATPVTRETVPGFYSEPRLVDAATAQLRDAGFEVLQTGRTTVTIAAPAALYEETFGTRIVAEERETLKYYGQDATATFLECPDTDVPGLIDPAGSPLLETIEGVALNEPVYPQVSAVPPIPAYWHLDVPEGVSRGIGADEAHRAGFTGRGVRVVMVDTGWYRHPYFARHGCAAARIVLGPGAANPEHDEDGHGTGESANLFAVAPGAELTMVKMNFANPAGAIKAAIALDPDIISCSWATSKANPPLSAADQATTAAVAEAVRRGIIVVFAAGNRYWGFPGQHPDVISVGGAFLRPDGVLEASNYASGFRSRLYPGRNVPDVCGLVGQRPYGRYIVLPVQPGGKADKTSSGTAHPDLDETAQDDGWAVFSGTSAAAPQLAGVCALMKQALPELSPAQAREVLVRSARDVTRGRCGEVWPVDGPEGAGGHEAAPGPDLATGAGLVDPNRAVEMALELGA
jgi:subtilisin family serine protease